ENALRRSTRAPAGHHWCLRPRSAPAIRRVRACDVRLPVAVADAADARNVPGAGVHVCAARSNRGGRGASRVRRPIQGRHGGCPRVPPALPPARLRPRVLTGNLSMFDPRILLGLILAGAWASGLLALDDEIERDEHQEPKTPEARHAGSS